MKKVSIEKIFGSELKEIMRLLRSSGKECYIVGGAIRDLLLGYEKFIDIDLTTSLSVEKMKQIFDRNKIRFDDRALKYGCLTVSNQNYARGTAITPWRGRRNNRVKISITFASKAWLRRGVVWCGVMWRGVAWRGVVWCIPRTAAWQERPTPRW